MQGIELAYANEMFRSLLEANGQLRESSLIEAVSRALRYGKGDTLGLDAIPEGVLMSWLKRFDPDAFLITEELGGQLPSRINDGSLLTLMYSDPTDRSRQFYLLLEERCKEKPTRKVGDVLDEDVIQEWEERFGSPARITGATSAITCVRGGLPVFSIILNYITLEVFLACNAGIKVLKLPHHTSPRYAKMTVHDILHNGRTVAFPQIGNRNHGACQQFVTFLGKAGYRENFNDSHIFSDGEDRQPVYDTPGGPTRSLYLSNLYDPPLGFILANGEKIGEWIHWLPVVRFASHAGEPALRIFEVWQDWPHTREGVNMAPSPIYSIFRGRNGEKSPIWIDVQPLSGFDRPSQYRATLVLAPADNVWVSEKMQRENYRELKFPSSR